MNKPANWLQEQVRGFSRALFSTWLYLRRFNILFDAGEGVATMLLNRVFGIRKIFLSHGHADHIAGLINLVNIRNLGAGDQTTELIIHYPKNNTLIETMKAYLSQTQSELSFDLVWKPLEPGEVIPLDTRRGKTYLKTFKTQHSQKQLSLGYNIVETRRRLRDEFVGKSQMEINEQIRKLGKENIAESFEQIIFTYGGDSRPIHPSHIENSLFLCHECTYLKVDDDERNFQQHSILDEVLRTARDAKVKALLLFHLSLRYTPEEIRETVANAMKSGKEEFKIGILFGDRLFDPLEPGFSRRKQRTRSWEDDDPEDEDGKLPPITLRGAD